MVSSTAMSFEDRFGFFSLKGGGEGPVGGGVMERRDLLEGPDGVRYGVPRGGGKGVAAGPLKYSSSVSQSGMVTAFPSSSGLGVPAAP